MNWRSDFSRRNGAALCCGAKNPADLLKTLVGWYLRNKRLEGQKFVAVPINSDMNAASRVSRGPISCGYESVGDFCVYFDFDRLFRSLRSHRLQFQRHTGECAVYPRYPGTERRHDHDSGRLVWLEHPGNDLEGYQAGGRWFRSDNWMEPEQSNLWDRNKGLYGAKRIYGSKRNDSANMEDSDEQGTELHAWDCFECFWYDPHNEHHTKHRKRQRPAMANRHGVFHSCSSQRRIKHTAYHYRDGCRQS